MPEAKLTLWQLWGNDCHPPNMNWRIVKNGREFCTVVRSEFPGGNPPTSDGEWHQCFVVTDRRLEAFGAEPLEMQGRDGVRRPFKVLSSCIGVDGWEVSGKIQC